MTKEQFKELDLREQLTEELKSKWYYKQAKSKLRVSKHKVVFDTYFKFNLKYVEPEYATETKDFTFEGVTYHQEKGELLSDGYIKVVDEEGESVALDMIDYSMNYYDSEDKAADNPKEILEHILLYIVNCI